MSITRKSIKCSGSRPRNGSTSMRAGGCSSRRLSAMQDFVKKMILLLADGGVEYVVVGGISAVLQGVPVVTLDLDICYRRTPENMNRLALALAPFEPKFRGLPPGLPN